MAARPSGGSLRSGNRGCGVSPRSGLDEGGARDPQGFRSDIDSYSAFFENDHKTPTGLGGYLKERGIDTVTLCGLATDYCVAYSALDAVSLGFKADVRLEASRGIDLGGSVAAMIGRMREAGVTIA